ncbi:MAG: SDR family NAD(P)-dependent oxidoreductase [Oligoflexia bacterium]|nr:SDR family NAD(P)-dependent oxidoreductase [Oligoflexia bacterium]
MFKSVVIIGASRGLGKALSFFIKEHLPGAKQILLVSRKIDLLTANAEKLKAQFEEVKTIKADMSMSADVFDLTHAIKSFNADIVIYSAGGGPYGEFVKKDWKDHQWAIDVGLKAPMQLLHSWLSFRNPTEAGRFIIVGSRIAESSPDFSASSYAATKHGLVGLLSSIQPELLKNNNKAWLFSPGYIDTEMLPPNASARHNGAKIMSVETAAQALLRWVKKDGPWHRILN